MKVVRPSNEAEEVADPMHPHVAVLCVCVRVLWYSTRAHEYLETVTARGVVVGACLCCGRKGVERMDSAA